MPEKKASKSAQSKPKSNRGGSRANAGRKPNAVREMRDGLIGSLISPPAPATPTGPPTAAPPPMPPGDAVAGARSDADRALDIIREFMGNDHPSDLRFKAARELLDRAIGKARIASAPVAKENGPQVIVYIPDNGRDSASEGES